MTIPFIEFIIYTVKGKRQHFLPQHYLLNFCISGTRQVAASLVSPYRFIGLAAINRQCQEDYFYGMDGLLDKVLQRTETDLAPILNRVVKARTFDEKELVALRLLATVLLSRTRKAAETAKVFSKHIAYEVLQGAIHRGNLPAPEGGLREEDIDFADVPGFLFKTTVLPCWLEMQTLQGKLLVADPSSHFITSDNPVVILNQLFAHLEPNRSFVGFSRSGFQLLIPLSPEIAVFFFDPKVYKVGARGSRCVTLSNADVEIINSLQFQTAENCVYFHNPAMEPVVKQLCLRYIRSRRAPKDTLRILQGRTENETFLHLRAASVLLPKRWTFCRHVRHIRIGLDKRRNPAWSSLVNAVVEDMDNSPHAGDIFDRMERILGCSFRGMNTSPENLS